MKGLVKYKDPSVIQYYGPFLNSEDKDQVKFLQKAIAKILKVCGQV